MLRILLFAVISTLITVACAPVEDDAAIGTPTPVHSPVPAAQAPIVNTRPALTHQPTQAPAATPTLESAAELLHPPVDSSGDRSILSVGFFSACALGPDGKADCWDFSQDVEPIDPDMPAIPMELAPPPDESFVSISGSQFHYCGLRGDGTPVCWLAGDEDELQEPAPPPEGERFTSIDVRNCYTCGLRADGTPKCWQQFIGMDLCEGYALAEPPAGESFAALTGNEGYSCGLRRDGTALCYPDVESDSGVDHDIEELFREREAERYTAISAGDWSICALRQGGIPFCWHWDVLAVAYVEAGHQPDVGGSGQHQHRRLSRLRAAGGGKRRSAGMYLTRRFPAPCRRKGLGLQPLKAGISTHAAWGRTGPSTVGQCPWTDATPFATRLRLLQRRQLIQQSPHRPLLLIGIVLHNHLASTHWSMVNAPEGVKSATGD